MTGMWDSIWKSEEIHDYGEVLFQLRERLFKKHEQKGHSYRDMKLATLMAILKGEMKELETEFWGKSTQGVIEEALDVAICGIIIADWTIREDIRLKREFPDWFHDNERPDTSSHIGAGGKPSPRK